MEADSILMKRNEWIPGKCVLFINLNAICNGCNFHEWIFHVKIHSQLNEHIFKY